MTEQVSDRALGVILRARRERFGRPQDLQQWGGPGEITVRKIERGRGVGMRPKTRRQLEVALNYPDGMIDRIISGEVTEDSPELGEVVVRAEPLHLREQRESALFDVLDAFTGMASSLEGAVTHLKSNGWTDDQARAIVAHSFGWRPKDGSKPEGVD